MTHTANERFKRNAHRWQLGAGVLAVVAHVLVLVLTPAFEIEAVSGSRMVITIGPWREPHDLTAANAGYLPFDSTLAQPRLSNQHAVNHRIPRIYPWTLWHYREPSSVLLQLSVSRSGRIRAAQLLEREGTETEEALLRLARLMRFEPLQLPHGPDGLMGTVEVGVVPP